MESVQSILSTILKFVETLPSENVPLMESIGCIAGEDIVSTSDFPAATISLVDGFASRSVWLEAASTQNSIQLPIASRHLIPQKTSSPVVVPIGLFDRLPPGFDVVIPAEEGFLGDGFLVVEKTLERWENVLPIGSQIRKGQVILPKGTEITYSDIGLASFLGLGTLPVIRRPQVALIFVCPSIKRVKDRETFRRYVNGIADAVAAQVVKYQGVIKQYKILSDFSEGDQVAFSRALKSDLILFVGECTKRSQLELIRILAKKKVHFHLQTQNVYPGYFFSFGTLNEKLIFLLPNDPTGVILNFEEFVRPALFKMRGKRQIRHNEVNARLGKTLKNAEGKIALIQASVYLKNGVFYAVPLENGYQSGFGTIRSINGIIILPQDVKQVPVGSVMRVQMLRQLDWEF